MKNLPVLEIFWRDAECDVPGWESNEDSIGHKCPLVRSVGQLLEQTEDAYLLVMCSSGEENIGRFRIPVAWVEKVIELKPAGKKDWAVY